MRGPLLLVSSVLSAGFVLAPLFLLALQLLPLLLLLHQKHTLLPLSPTPGFPSLELAAGALICGQPASTFCASPGPVF